MIQYIDVKPETHCDQVLFSKEFDFTKLPNPQIIPLFGPNGIGKSTLLKGIWDTYINEKIKDQDPIWKLFNNVSRLTSDLVVTVHSDGPSEHDMYGYFNGRDNFRRREARSLRESLDTDCIVRGFVDRRAANILSEGQSTQYSVLYLLSALAPGKNMIGEFDTETVVLLDEIDSGLSVDNIDMCMRKIQRAIRLRPKLQVIMGFTSPRVLKFFPNVVSMYDGSIIEMHTDEDMMTEIQKHKKEFDKCRKLANGFPRVPKDY